ncbi:phage integrase [Buttiauxella gaviniae ATCC 51604]|uniref:Phage integrase n=1 Tax=Buttiauxella gaviniae ATCC 51604 TaxID=1354253 RepID=A0A1B7HQA4_9ENTR|nr:site-specific integrase [Buttiauxella gaviniae]OAT17833.1 phage integrase [Buttiauxella gaviniae ATCC 51604]
MNFPTGVELHNGKIRISFTYRGTRCREVLRGWLVSNANIKKAGNFRALVVSEIQMGTFDYAQRFPESKALSKFGTKKRISTFAELCDLFLESKSLEVSAASMQTITSSVNTLRRTVGNLTCITDIQHADMLNYRRELLIGQVLNPGLPNLKKQGRSPSRVNTLMSLLAGMLKIANRSQFISHSPYEGVSALKVSKRSPDPLSFDEFNSFMSVLSRHHTLIWLVAIHTGMRHGELCALAWEDIDLQKGEIRISRNLTQRGIFVPPKTEAGIRTVSLLKPALDALTEQFKITGGFPGHEILYHHREHGRTEKQTIRTVFVPTSHSKKKTGYFSQSSISYGWRYGLRRAGVRSRHSYQSRHTYACWSLSAGANPSFIASQLGHEDSRMVYEVYAKWIGDMDRDQVNMINNRIPSSLPPLRPKGELKLLKVV